MAAQLMASLTIAGHTMPTVLWMGVGLVMMIAGYIVLGAASAVRK